MMTKTPINAKKAKDDEQKYMIIVILFTVLASTLGCPQVDGKICSGNGLCSRWNTCLCDNMYSGKDCSSFSTTIIV